MDKFVAALLSTQNLLLMTAAGGLLEALKRTYPTQLWLRRFGRLLPTAVTSALIWLPGIHPEMTVGERILLGICLGVFTNATYDIIMKVIFRKHYVAKSLPKLHQEYQQITDDLPPKLRQSTDDIIERITTKDIIHKAPIPRTPTPPERQITKVD